MMEKILVVGCGITGSVTASLLRRALPENCKIKMWEKSRGAGGRMSTSRSAHDSQCTADLGAQYISAEPPDYKAHQLIYKELVSSGVLQPFSGIIENERKYPTGTTHFVPPKGMGSLVKHFLNASEATVEYEQLVTEVMVTSDNRLSVSTQQGRTDVFDCVVLTQPVPQILQLQGSFTSLIDQGIKEKMEKVTYSSRYALGLFYKPGTFIDVPWCASYIDGDPILRFVAIDSKKRGLENDTVGPSVVVHTSVPFGLDHLQEDKDMVGSNLVLPRLRHTLPAIPTPASVKNHCWKYSQVFQPYDGSPGQVVLSHKPLLLCGGDGFSFSKFDGCIHSAKAMAQTILQANNSTSL